MKLTDSLPGSGLFVRDATMAISHTTFLRNSVLDATGQAASCIIYIEAVDSPSAFLRLGENVTFPRSFAKAGVGVNETQRTGPSVQVGPGSEEQVYSAQTLNVSYGDAYFESAALTDAPPGIFRSLEDADFIQLQKVRVHKTSIHMCATNRPITL
jgi:hypothetical protein